MLMRAVLLQEEELYTDPTTSGRSGDQDCVLLLSMSHPEVESAAQVIRKAPIAEAKQVEHVANERRILQAAAHPFCVRLAGAYQDAHNLYLLLEWVGGAP